MIPLLHEKFDLCGWGKALRRFLADFLAKISFADQESSRRRDAT